MPTLLSILAGLLLLYLPTHAQTITNPAARALGDNGAMNDEDGDEI